MARTRQSCYKVEFSTNIRGHHIYKDSWRPTIGGVLQCRRDETAQRFDKNAVGVFKADELVGHLPRQISTIIAQYLDVSEHNTLTAVVSGKRKREGGEGLSVPAKFSATDNTNLI